MLSAHYNNLSGTMLILKLIRHQYRCKAMVATRSRFEYMLPCCVVRVVACFRVKDKDVTRSRLGVASCLPSI